MTTERMDDTNIIPIEGSHLYGVPIILSRDGLRQKRKEWLEKEISLLEDKSLWGDFPPQDKLWLDSYKEELKGINENQV